MESVGFTPTLKRGILSSKKDRSALVGSQVSSVYPQFGTHYDSLPNTCPLLPIKTKTRGGLAVVRALSGMNPLESFLNAPGRSTRGARCALRLAHGVRSPPVLTPKRRSRFEPPLTLFAETSPAVVERLAPFSPTPARVAGRCASRCGGYRDSPERSVVAPLSSRSTSTPRRASRLEWPRNSVPLSRRSLRGTHCVRSALRSPPRSGADERLTPFASRRSLRKTRHTRLPCTHSLHSWELRSRLALFAATPLTSWRSRCSRHASLAPFRCASRQVWLRLRP